MEEDIQNLVHRELFPLYKYKIGTPEQPAEPDEIDRAAVEIENLRAEGGLILPHRHDVEVIGGQGESLDASSYLEHFKERVAVGLGVAPHHLGMTMNGGNRAMSERLDTALYDKIKNYQRLFSEMIRLNIFNELLFEGGFDPVMNPLQDGTSDRCYFRFKEIDVDTQVKKETHAIQKYVNNIATLDETRLALGYDSDIDMQNTFAAIQAGIQVDIATATAADKQNGQAPSPKSSDGQEPAKKGQRNLPNGRKGNGNLVRPSNQYGKRTSPDIKRDDSEFLSVIEKLLDEEYTVMESEQKKD